LAFAGGEERFDMTDVVAKALAAGLRVGGFAIREYWIDIGQLADYQRAESDHVTVFSAES
jgi:NDP-sugar pyrophosphorylase family protein